jgi:hypothetical protein
MLEICITEPSAPGPRPPEVKIADAKYNDAVCQLLMDFKTACDSLGREISYSILIQYGVPIKLWLIKMCLMVCPKRNQTFF